MQAICKFLTLGATALSIACTAVARDNDVAPGRPFTVKIIGFNNYHGNLQSRGSFGVNTSIPFA